MKKLSVAKLKTHKKQIIIFLVLLLVAACCAAFWWMNQRATKEESPVVTYSTDSPSEEKPGDDYNWQGGPQDPKKIKIPKINVDAFIQQVGVDQNNEVAVPNNLFVAGWFNDTVRPGEKGLSLIAGHVTGRRNDGIFKDLEKLSEGDIYTIEFGDGSTKNFKVIGKKSAPVNESVSIMFSQNPKVSNQLNLVTCSGTYDDKARTYSERLTISSEKI